MPGVLPRLGSSVLFFVRSWTRKILLLFYVAYGTQFFALQYFFLLGLSKAKFALLSRSSRLFILRTPRFRKRLSSCIPGCKSHQGRLCDGCEHLIDSSSLLTGTKSVFASSSETHDHLSLFRLRESSLDCHLCHILNSSLGTTGPADSASPLEVKIYQTYTIESGGELWLEVVGRSQASLSSEPLRIFERPNELNDHLCKTGNTAEDREFQVQANRWIEKCQEHPKCQQYYSLVGQEDFCPTRVLDVERYHSGTIRLVETNSLKGISPLRYTALSHRWGGVVPLRLLSRSYNDMKNGIPISQLPRSFRQAVRTTRALEVQYLWIDSLCIIQDSSADWQIESAQMGSIFTNAFCTISAALAENPNQGYFFNVTPFRDDCRLRTSATRSLFVEAHPRPNTIPALFKGEVEEGPLGSRGWIFQERLLSRRILHFARQAVLFECNTLWASEFSPDGERYSKRLNNRSDKPTMEVTTGASVDDGASPLTIGDAVRRAPLSSVQPIFGSIMGKFVIQEDFLDHLLDTFPNDGMRGAFELLLKSSLTELLFRDVLHLAELHMRWFELVKIYSKMTLTKSSDKLVAIAGLASMIERISSRSFVAGVWRETIHFDLLWFHTDNNVTARPNRPVPTWSWASVDHAVLSCTDLGKWENQSNPNELKGTYTANKILHFLADLENSRQAFKLVVFMPLIRIEHVESLQEIGSVVTNARLLIYGSVAGTDNTFEGIQFFMDLASTQDPKVSIIQQCLPILETHYGIPSDSTEGDICQLHGITIESTSCNNFEYERTGYFVVQGKDSIRKFNQSLGSRHKVCLV